MKKKVFTYSKNMLSVIEKYKSSDTIDIYVYDNYCMENEINGYPRISFEELIINKEEYVVYVTNSSIKSTYEICKQMKEHGIQYVIPDEKILLKNTVHVFGTVCEDNKRLQYEWVRSSDNRQIYSKLEIQVEELFRETISFYYDELKGKRIDIYFYLEDMPQDAYRLAWLFDMKNILACCTVFPISHCVVPIPNYFSCINESTYQWPEDVPSKLMKAAEEPWSISKGVWIGDIDNSPDDLRRMLHLLGELHPNKLEIINSAGFWKGMNCNNTIHSFIPMIELPKYKYLIDIRGYSFYARMTRLLIMKRVVLRIESIYREWYDEYLIPMKHYVPIKADMSDLLSQMEFLDNRQDVYDEIVWEMSKFAGEYLKPEAYLCSVKNAILKYGIRSAK